MLALALLASATLRPPAPEPVLWMTPQGTLTVNGKRVEGRLGKGAKAVATPLGTGLDVSGGRSGLFLPDRPELALTKEITVATWIYLRRYVTHGPGAQILMRGDDRNGNDPYFLTVHPDGTVTFAIDGEDGGRTETSAALPLKQWVRITASYDPEGHEMRLWINDRMMAANTADRRPINGLDKTKHPGVGIGNVQTDEGPHDQPLDGILVDLRVYAAALSPQGAGFRALNGG